MESGLHKPLLIGDWEVHPRMNRLRMGSSEHRISPKFMHVLLRLADAKGEVVTRDELMDAVWGDTIVGEAVLTRAVSELRKVLCPGESADSAIETIPTVGYRLAMPVRELELSSDSAASPPDRSVHIAEVVLSDNLISSGRSSKDAPQRGETPASSGCRWRFCATACIPVVLRSDTYRGHAV